MIIVHWKGMKHVFNVGNIAAVQLSNEAGYGGKGRKTLLVSFAGDPEGWQFSSTDGDVDKLYETFLSAMGMGKNITIFSGKEKA